MALEDTGENLRKNEAVRRSYLGYYTSSRRPRQLPIEPQVVNPALSSVPSADKLGDRQCRRRLSTHSVRALLPRETLLAQVALVAGGKRRFSRSRRRSVCRLPFTPVPVTGQTFAVLLAGALLGGRLGAASMTTYWTAGACGLPVFNGWGGGWAIASGPTGGYIVGFIAAAFVVGWFAERGWDRGPRIMLAAAGRQGPHLRVRAPLAGPFVGPHDGPPCRPVALHSRRLAQAGGGDGRAARRLDGRAQAAGCLSGADIHP